MSQEHKAKRMLVELYEVVSLRDNIENSRIVSLHRWGYGRIAIFAQPFTLRRETDLIAATFFFLLFLFSVDHERRQKAK